MFVFARTKNLEANTALREWPRWRRGRRWPVLLALVGGRSVEDLCKGGESDETSESKATLTATGGWHGSIDLCL